MSLTGAPPNTPEFSDPSHPTPPLPGDVPLPVRVRSPRGPNGAPKAEDHGDDAPFPGCPFFPANGMDSRGVAYAERFEKAKLTEASIPDLGLRLRLVSPSPDRDGTSRPTFGIPLLHIDTTPEAIHERWGPGRYEVSLCRRTANDRARQEIVSRRVTLDVRCGGEFGPEGEYDVGREPWPINLDEDASVTEEIRDEIARREEIREEIKQSGGSPYADSYDLRGPAHGLHGGHDRYAPPPPPSAPLGPAMPPAGVFPQGTTFVQINGQWVAQAPSAPVPPKPSALDALVAKFSDDPVATVSGLGAALAALKGIVAPPAPPPPPAPTAQDIAAAVAAALAPVLQAVTAKPAGPGPMEVFQAQLQAEREAAERRAAEARAEAARLEADRERQRAEDRVKAEREAAARDQRFALQLEAMRTEAKLAELRHQLDGAKNASESEKASLTREITELSKKLRAGEEDSPPTLLEQAAGLLDSKFGEAIAPFVGPSIARALDNFGTPPAPPAPAPQVVPQFALPPQPYPYPPMAEATHAHPAPAPMAEPPPTADDGAAEGNDDDSEAP